MGIFDIFARRLDIFGGHRTDKPCRPSRYWTDTACPPHDANMATDRSVELDDLIAEARCRAALPPPPRRREIRKRAGASLDRVARACGVTKQAVSNWETGRRAPAREHVRRYAAVLSQLDAAVGGPQ